MKSYLHQIQPQSEDSPKFPGLCSVTIFLTDLDGTVTQHDGNFLAVDGFPFFDGNVLAVDGKSKFDRIFTAVTQHDGKFWR